MPPFAMVLYAASICTAVTARPCPIGTVAMVVPDHCDDAGTKPADSPGEIDIGQFADTEVMDVLDQSRKAQALGYFYRADI